MATFKQNDDLSIYEAISFKTGSIDFHKFYGRRFTSHVSYHGIGIDLMSLKAFFFNYH